MAITDGTAAAGLPVGARARLGGQPIVAGRGTAVLPDGTRAGSLLTMDGAFRMLVGQAGLSMIDAATMCATTAARELGLIGHGAPGRRCRGRLRRARPSASGRPDLRGRHPGLLARICEPFAAAHRLTGNLELGSLLDLGAVLGPGRRLWSFVVLSSKFQLPRRVMCRDWLPPSGCPSWVRCPRVAWISSPPARSRYVERVERSFAVTGRPDVSVSTFDGSIEVHSWDRPDVLVVDREDGRRQGRRRADRGARRADRQPDCPRRPAPDRRAVSISAGLGSRGARLIVTMPEAGDLRAKSGDGSIVVDASGGQNSPASRATAACAPAISRAISPCHTGDGSMHLDNVSGKLDVSTGDGSIVVGGSLVDAQGTVRRRQRAHSGR